MTENPYQPMAQQWIAFWQKQLADGLMDEKLVGQMIDWMHQMQMTPKQEAGTPHAPHHHPTAKTTENPAVSPEHAGDAVARLEQRIRALESELGELKQTVAQLRTDRG